MQKCVRDYKDPNTYIIDASCVPAAAWASNKGVIIGAAVVAAALIGSGGDKDPGPISNGPRN